MKTLFAKPSITFLIFLLASTAQSTPLPALNNILVARDAQTGTGTVIYNPPVVHSIRSDSSPVLPVLFPRVDPPNFKEEDDPVDPGQYPASSSSSHSTRIETDEEATLTKLQNLDREAHRLFLAKQAIKFRQTVWEIKFYDYRIIDISGPEPRRSSNPYSPRVRQRVNEISSSLWDMWYKRDQKTFIFIGTPVRPRGFQLDYTYGKSLFSD
ncbi:hypothetical protein H0H93_015645 [Arthromyces matolae]|nr:hypothetical protein H0H93_015645 [Arthromyces matolae]